MDDHQKFDREVFEIKKELRQCLKRVGGKCAIQDLEIELRKKIDYRKCGFDSFCELVRNFQDILSIDCFTISLKDDIECRPKNFMEEYNEACYEAIELDESNEALLYESSSSSSSITYKDIQNSMKIPSELQEYTGSHQMSDNDTSECSEKEFQKTVNKIYNIDDHEKCSKSEEVEAIENEKLDDSFNSLEALSSICGDEFAVDPEELDRMMEDDDDNGSIVSLNQFISSLPIDDEVFYSHLLPVNRDIKATVPQQKIPKNFEDKIVYFSEIFDPVHFWFQFVTGDERFEDFETFHNKINNDYRKLKARDLVISEENYTEGLIVAAYVEKFKRWYRARIVDNYDNERATVRLFFIDYGTNGACKKAHIKYLYQYFMKYPQYCFRGRIHGIVPPKNERNFKFNHIEEFIKKISHHSFNAAVVKYESEEDVYQLEMIRRKGDINIREYLLENNYAEQMNPRENDGEFSIGPPCYLIPSFQALEYDYPTYASLDGMHRADINFNLLLNNHFLHRLTLDDVEKDEELQAVIQNPQFKMTKKYFLGYF